VTAGSSRLGYVTSGFPTQTETFVRREIDQARALGVTITVFPLRPQPRQLADPALVPYVEDTVYTPWALSGALLGSHRWAWRRDRRRYLRTLYRCVRAAFRHGWHLDMVAKTLAIWPKTVHIARLMDERSVDHVHAHFANHPTTAAMLIAELLGLPFSFTAHAWDIFVAKNQVLLPEKLARARVAVTCTEFNADFLRRFRGGDGARRIAMHYHGIQRWEAPADPREPRMVVAVGSLAEKKGFRVLLDACARLRDGNVPFRCVIVGEGPLRARLESQIRRLRLAGDVTLLGARPHEEVMRLLARAAVFVMPSVRARDGEMDGIPNVVLEALSVATPVIATRLSAIPEVVRHGETGRLVPPGDDQALAEAIAATLREPEPARAMARRGQDLVRGQFDIEANVRRLLASLAGSQCRPPAA
jgi:glycosyltransferase involved in cell wall biosynthesis